MKKAITVAALAVLSLTGCMQAPEFTAAPETMPAIEAKDMPSPDPAVHSGPWDAEDVLVSGTTPELQADAQQALDSHASYYDQIGAKYRKHRYAVNVHGFDRWFNIIEVKSEKSRSIEFVLDSNFKSGGLRELATGLGCGLVRFGLDDEDAVSWLKSLTVTADKSGESFTMTDMSECG